MAMMISLFSSRYLLQMLGVDDYGIYNVVAGTVALVAVLNGAMSGASSRFLTFELGRGDLNKLKNTFNCVLQFHFGIAIIILLIGETIGLWFFNTYVSIPLSRIYAAQWVYQASLIIAVLNVIQVPCRADVIAHEDMGVFAFIEILNVSLQFIIIFIAKNIGGDLLILYACLMVGVALIILMIYCLYCRSHYSECRLHRKFDKATFKPILSFSTYELYGNGCVVVKDQGINLLINHFFGVALNAASGIAIQAGAIIQVFVANITMALRPPMIKSYAAGDIQRLQQLLGFAISVCVILLACVIVPLFFDIKVLMNIWLVEVPPYAETFCKIILLINAISVFNVLLNICIHATGNVKRLDVLNGSLFVSVVPISWLVYKSGAGPSASFVVALIIMVLVIISAAVITRRQIKALSLKAVLKQTLRPISALFVAIPLTILIGTTMQSGLIRLVVVTLNTIILVAFFEYLIWIKPKYNGSIKALLSEIS